MCVNRACDDFDDCLLNHVEGTGRDFPPFHLLESTKIIHKSIINFPSMLIDDTLPDRFDATSFDKCPAEHTRHGDENRRNTVPLVSFHFFGPITCYVTRSGSKFSRIEIDKNGSHSEGNRFQDITCDWTNVEK